MSDTQNVPAELGTMVTYADSFGRVKAAMVVATEVTLPEADTSPSNGTETPAVLPGHVHVYVFTFTGRPYVKHNVTPGPGGSFISPENVPAEATPAE